MKKILVFTSVFLLVVFLFGCVQDNSNSANNNDANNNKTSTNNGNNNNNNNEEPALQPLKIEDYFPIKANTHYVYQGMGNEYASYDVYIDYASEDKVQQRVDNGGTVMANVLELKDGKLTKLYSREKPIIGKIF